MAEENSGSHRTRAPKFEGKDFWTWSFRFQQWAACEELLPYFDGTVVPRPAADGDDQRKWDRLNQRAFAELCTALVPDELIRLVREFGQTVTPARQAGQPSTVTRARPRQAWQRLENFFVQRQLSSRIVLERQLNTLAMEPGESVEKYWARADDLRQQLQAAGGEISTQSWMGKVIAGLSDSWEVLKVVLNTQFANMDETQLLTALNAEAARQQEQKSASALTTWGSSGRGRGRGGGKSGRGGGRGAPQAQESKASDQPPPKVLGKDGTWGRMGPAPKGHCHGCHKPNHTWQECRRRPENAVPECVKKWDQKRGQRGEAHAAGEGDQPPVVFGDLAVVELVAGEATVAVTQPKQGWWMDSGASHNFTPYQDDFLGPLQAPEVAKVRVGDGRVLRTAGMGHVCVQGHGGRLVTLTKVHLVPELHTRLLSSPHLTAKGFDVLFTGQRCEVKRGGELYMTGTKEGGNDHGITMMDLSVYNPNKQQSKSKSSEGAAQATTALGAMELAHQRMGHVAPSTLCRMVAAGAVTGLTVAGRPEDMPTCETCMLAKIAKHPFPDASKTSVSHPLELVHADLWGPVRVPSFGGKALYVLSLIDQATDMVWAFPLPNKASKTVCAALEEWRLKAERQANRRLITLRTDNGTEFKGEVQEWLQELGISRQRSAPYTPQQNGKVERWHRTMAEGIRALLLHSGLPASLWAEALRHVVWVKNRTAHSAQKGCKTPYEVWTGRKPDVSMLRVWGSMGCVKLNTPEQGEQGKLGSRGVMCVCLGVDDEAKAYRMLDPELMRLRITVHVDFLESQTWQVWAHGKTGGKLAVEAPQAVLQLLPPQAQLQPVLDETQELGALEQAPPPLRRSARLQERHRLAPPLPSLPEVSEEEEQSPQEPQPVQQAQPQERRSMVQLLQEQLQVQGEDVDDALADTAVASCLLVAQAREPSSAKEALEGPDREL
jgi:hypothetical protein